MDTIDNYRQIVQQVLKKYSEIPYAHGEIKAITIFDRENDRYSLITVGWQGDKRVHGCLVHLDIINGKVWIQRDGTEYGIAKELVDNGIPKGQIILAFHPPEVREHTEYATT